MLIPRHCSNPKCQRAYIGRDGVDRYRQVLIKLSSEQPIRVVSICSECRKDFDLQMAKDVLGEVLPVEINQVAEDALLTAEQKMAKIDSLTNYQITAIGRDIDELRKKL